MLRSKSTSCDACLQLNCLINRYCSQKWKSFLTKNKLFIDYSPKQTIFFEGGLVSGVYFIYNGKIKVYNTAEKGKQNIIRLVGSDEMLGLRGFAEKQYLVSAATLEDSSLCFFEKQIFIETIKANPEFALHLVEFYAHQLSSIEISRRNYSQLSNNAKIAESLLRIKDKFGVALGESEYFLDVVLSRQEIADIAGTCVGGAIRALTFFKKEQIIKIKKKKITISNIDKFNKFILEKSLKKEKQHTF